VINHARTLLLNSSGADRPPPDYFLEEYVDPKFGAVELPGYLQRARAPLFSDAADDAYKNYIMRICTTLLHSTEFAAYVLDLDRRVTYLNRPSVALTESAITATPLNEQAALGAADVTGTPQLYKQRAQWDWLVDVVSGGPNLFTVRVTLRVPNTVQEFNVNFAGGYSDLIPLPGQDQLFFRFKDVMTAGMLWGATAFLMPTVDLSDMMEAFANTGNTGQLFGTQEPYKTFGELWNKHVYLNYKMSGYLLALAYRTEEVRQNATG
jgi:hypothetical protein